MQSSLNNEVLSDRILMLELNNVFRGSSMVERRPVDKTCSSLRKLKDELFGITVKATSKDMLIPWELQPVLESAVETRYRRSVMRNQRIRYSPPHIESYGLCVRRWFQVRVLAAEPVKIATIYVAIFFDPKQDSNLLLKNA